jgi:hypothetical protein
MFVDLRHNLSLIGKNLALYVPPQPTCPAAVGPYEHTYVNIVYTQKGSTSCLPLYFLHGFAPHYCISQPPPLLRAWNGGWGKEGLWIWVQEASWGIIHEFSNIMQNALWTPTCAHARATQSTHFSYFFVMHARSCSRRVMHCMQCACLSVLKNE